MPNNKRDKHDAPLESYIDAQLVRKRLAELRPILANVVVGDFSKDLKIPKKEDEFTELFVGVQLMQEVIREQLKELRDLNQALGTTASERSSALEEAQALTHLGSWQWDIATNIISWSDELYRIFGLRPQERQIGFEEFISMVHPDDRERISSTIGTSFKTGLPFDFEHRIILPNKKQRTLYGLGKVIADASGNPLRMVGTSQDITERKINELALQQSDERFRAVTKATHDLVYDMDMQKGTMWFNEALHTEYGYSKVMTHTTLEWWTAHIHSDDALKVESQISEVLDSNQQMWHTEFRFKKADKSYAVVRNRAFILHDQNGKPDRIVGSFLDITRQKQLDRAKDEFTSLVSHQLRTPLTIIRFYTKMLTEGFLGPLSPDQGNHVQKITSASDRLIRLVSDILNISRLELDRINIEPQAVDANELIQMHIDELLPLAQEKQIRLTFVTDKSLSTVDLDATVFGEIIRNLVSNAIHYTKPQVGQIEIRFQKQKRGYILSVRDNGIGIPERDKPHIFSRFYRANNARQTEGDGTGLGLYLIKLIVDTFNGKVWYKSREGKGTTFFVLIPPHGMIAKKSTANSFSATE